MSFFFVCQEVEHSGIALAEKMDKILEDSIPCRVRAKRGCATHPRSIAERVTLYNTFHNTNSSNILYQCTSF